MLIAMKIAALLKVRMINLSWKTIIEYISISLDQTSREIMSSTQACALSKLTIQLFYYKLFR